MAFDAVLTEAVGPPRALPHHRSQTAVRASERAKRVIDFSTALLAIVVLSPLLALLAAILVISTGNSAIYRHRRVGRNGQPFRCYKFQTMRPDAAAVLAAHLAADPAAAREWAETHKLRDDPRITPLGRILRITSLDELPQLFNILFGQMSFVGPRPVTFDELAHYGPQAYNYLMARPGLTGLWQISGRTSLSYSERVALDMLYLRTRSVSLDLLILIKTVPAVARIRNSA